MWAIAFQKLWSRPKQTLLSKVKLVTIMNVTCGYKNKTGLQKQFGRVVDEEAGEHLHSLLSLSPF